jgi:hypothetical protein
VRRQVFAQSGGFSTTFARPSIEDIELGVRLRRSGYRIWLCADVQVAHLKRWTLESWLRADIRDRAIPWTHLILSGTKLPPGLGLDRKSQLSAVAAWLFVLSTLTALWQPAALAVAGLLAALLVALNLGLYRLFVQRGGLAFALGAVALHIVYYLYSSLIFGSMFIWHRLGKPLAATLAPFRSKAQATEAKHDSQ